MTNKVKLLSNEPQVRLLSNEPQLLSDENSQIKLLAEEPTQYEELDITNNYNTMGLMTNLINRALDKQIVN